MRTGTVKWFNSKGYGFIRPDDGTRDVFVHFSGIVGADYRTLYEGEDVEYEVTETARGPMARNVIVARSPHDGIDPRLVGERIDGVLPEEPTRE